MIIRYKKKDKFFICLYFSMITILLLTEVENFTIGGPLRKIKYLYIFLMFVYMIYTHKISGRLVMALLPLMVLTTHAILWGTEFVNPDVYSYTQKHVRECLILYLVIFVTFYYVVVTHSFLLFVELSYIAVLCQLAFAAVTHFGNFVNPLYYIYIFNESMRIRYTFGFCAWGYVGNYTYCALALSLILFCYLKDVENNKLSLGIIAFGDFSALCMACSAASRSTLIAGFLTVFYYLTFEYFRKSRKQSIRIWICILIIAITAGLIIYCLNNGTRDLNIEGNMEAFRQLGSKWTGMGYVENHNFQEDNSVFSVETTSLDISYVYYYFTTGILGLFFIIGAAAMILIMLFFCQSKYKTAVLAIYVSMLFYAQWQVNLFSYSFFSTIIFMVIYLSAIADRTGNQNNESIVKFDIL